MTEYTENNPENPSENTRRRDTMRGIVAKLLNLAMHTGTPKHEADTAMVRATEIMAKYNIAHHEAILKDNKRIEDTMTEVLMDMFYSYKSQGWEAFLGKGIADAFDCEILISQKANWSGENDKISFLGNDQDVANVAYFFDYLQMLVAGESRQRYIKIGDRNDFGMGASRRIGERLKVLYDKTAKAMPSNCTALIVVKKGAVSAFVKQKYPRTGTIYSKQVRNGDAYYSGKSYGNTVGLSKGVGGASPTPQIT